MIREYISIPPTLSEAEYVYDVYFTEGTEENTADFDDYMLDSLGSLTSSCHLKTQSVAMAQYLQYLRSELRVVPCLTECNFGKSAFF